MDINNNRTKRTEKIIIETQLIDRKNYENFFKNSEKNDGLEDTSEEQTILEMKKGYNDIHNFNKNKKNKNEENIKDKKDNKENSKEFNNKNIDINVNNSIKSLINEKKETEKEKEEKEEKENIDKEKNSIEKSIKIEKEGYDKDDKIEEKIENDKKSNNNKIEEIIDLENKNNDLLIDDKNNIQEENVNEKNEENKLSIKTELNKINNVIPEEADKEELSLMSPKLNTSEEIKDKKEIEFKQKLQDKDNNEDIVNIQEKTEILDKNKDNNIDDNSLTNSQLKKKLEKSRSLTPKSQRESKIINSAELNKDNNQSNIDIFNHDKKANNDSMSFYCGKLSEFIPLYSSYFNNIPQEQKIIFNLKSNPLDYIHNNFYPKIIIFNDKKTQTIKGLCIISHIHWKKNELYIEHISSYKDEEKEKIFEMFLSFIKENSYYILGYDNNIKENDIYIDLYYKCEEGKFSINEGIRDYFRNGLKFKWVKLENISKSERYMKIRHHFLINNNNDLLNNENDDNNILNKSIMGKKEFNDESNNKSEEEKEEESEDEDKNNLDISNVFEIDKDKSYMKNNISIKEGNIHNKNKNPNILNNFMIKNKTVIKFNNKIYENKMNKNENIKYSNPLNFIYLLNKIYNNTTNKNLFEIISPNIKSYFNEKDSEKMQQVLQKYTKIKTNLMSEYSFYYSDISDLSKEIINKFKLNANINITPSFDNCISFTYNGYHYNRIQVPKLEIFKEKLTQQLFYMISKNENHVILISSDLNEMFIEKYINKQNKDNISVNFMSIYNNFSIVEPVDNTILYIPAFEVKSKLVNNCYDKIPPEKKYNLYCYEDYYNIKYFTEELASNRNIQKYKIKKNIKTDINFEYDLIKEEQINQPNFIKDNFLLIAFDLNLMEQIKDFPLLTLYIEKENFILKK